MQQMEKAREFLNRDHSWRYDMVILSISFVFHAIFWWYLKTHYAFVYSMSDDMLYRDMINGVLYGKITHNIIYQHWFSVMLSWLYTTFPGLEWCGMLTIFVNFISGMTIYYCICKLAKTIPSLIVANGAYALFLLAYVRRLIYPTYTEIVAFLCAATILLYFTAVKRGEHSKVVYRISIVVCVLYVILGYSWRSESFLMMAPFALAVWGAMFIMSDKQKRIRAGIFAGIVIIVLGTVIVENKIAYSIEPYDKVMTYYDAKIAMTDYSQIPLYEEAAEKYDEFGVSEQAATFLYNRAYPLAPDYNVDGFVKMGEYVGSIKHQVSLSGMWELFCDTFAFQNMGLLGSIAGVVLLFAVLLALVSRDQGAIIGLVFHGLAYLVVTAYLVYRGRIPDRIIVMAYMILFWICVVYVICATDKLIATARHRWPKASMILVSLALVMVFSWTVIQNKPHCETEMQELKQLYRIFADRERGFTRYFIENDENFYLTTPFLWGTGGYITVTAQESADNYAFVSGYMIMVPEWAETLERNGIDPDGILESAASNDKIHFIFDPGDEVLVELMQAYLNMHHSGKKMVQVDEIIKDFPVYHVE